VLQIKECILAGQDASLATGLALEAKGLQMLFASADQKEGMAAFIGKRTANFQGK
jgi:enoyl-CoA hydratase/carnithine racemase